MKQLTYRLAFSEIFLWQRQRLDRRQAGVNMDISTTSLKSRAQVAIQQREEKASPDSIRFHCGDGTEWGQKSYKLMENRQSTGKNLVMLFSKFTINVLVFSVIFLRHDHWGDHPPFSHAKSQVEGWNHPTAKLHLCHLCSKWCYHKRVRRRPSLLSPTPKILKDHGHGKSTKIHGGLHGVGTSAFRLAMEGDSPLPGLRMPTQLSGPLWSEEQWEMMC